jgi:pyruvate dehydrogenase E2 component (dihydrolipoamide acetyltransferase)
MLEFRLPDVGEGLEEGEIVAWLVAPGDTVARDQPLVEVQTDKATVELPSPVAGRVVRLAANAGEVVKVGQVLIVLEDGISPGTAPAAGTPAGAQPEPGVVATSGPGGAQPAAEAPAGAAIGRPKASPAVRKLALDSGVDLAAVEGTGPGGRILAADVEAAGSPTGVAEARIPGLRHAGSGQTGAGRQPLRGIRRVTAETMTRSWSEIPHITAMDELDATGLLDARRRLTETARGSGCPPEARGSGCPQEGGTEITLAVLFLAAVARGLRRHPLMNASLDMEAGEIVVHDGCHVGLAVATDAGLLVPVVRDADRRALPDLAAEVRRLAAAARDGKVDLADLRGGTFTVTNYGTLGGRFATPLIRPPEVGIMGFGAIRPRPFVVDGTVAARPTLPYCCSADHRLVDGDLLTAFSEHVAGLLADPVRLLAELLLG